VVVEALRRDVRDLPVGEPPSAQASSAESGENVRPLASRFVLRESSLAEPDARSTVSTRPSSLATARVLVSGDAASSSTRPSCPLRIRRVSLPSAGMMSRPSSPSESETHTTVEVPGRISGIRARTPGWSSSARAGPCSTGSQCAVPRTSAVTMRPVLQSEKSPNVDLADTGNGARPERTPPSCTLSRTGSASRDSSSHSSPAAW